MSYKPDQQDWMAFLYGELEGAEKEKMEQYILSSAEARLEFEKFNVCHNIIFYGCPSLLSRIFSVRNLS